MLKKQCAVCEADFLTPYSWATMCKECFIESKKNERENLFEQAAYWQERAEKAEEMINEQSIDPYMLRQLIQLCHPDKHGNSENSIKATKYLLSLRK